jgi:hypothetical protein
MSAYMLINLNLNTSEYRRLLDICRKLDTTEFINLTGIRNERKINVAGGEHFHLEPDP